MVTRRSLLVLAAASVPIEGAQAEGAPEGAPAQGAHAEGAPEGAHARTPAPSDAYLYVIWPSDGERIRGGFWCRFGLRNMGVTHSGDKHPNSGHHHLLVDVDEPLDMNRPIPNNKKCLHYGGGQTEARIELPPGPHTLQLILGDADHVPFDPPVISKKIRITVI
ncbi:MAG: DUF4399 domain-containing protein [Acetobacteraceae bacterium]|nr:DUF4399 domain-containing protein [Acetobacteraceae bacterium]